MSTARITVEVTPLDIAMGVRRSCFNCPIAKAVKRAIKRDDLEIGIEPCRVLAKKLDAQLTYGSFEHFAILPEEAMRFINSFDNEEPVQPFAFELLTEASTK